MAHPNPDHPSFGTRPALYGLPSLPATPTPPPSLLHQLLAEEESPELAGLAAAVGGIDALAALHADPWADEPLDLDVLGPACRRQLEVVVRLVRSCPLRDVDDEYHVIVGRMAHRLAQDQPALFRRGIAQRTAAALVWLALHANLELGDDPGLVQSHEVWAAFGVTSCLDRARLLYAALAVVPSENISWLVPFRVETWMADVSFLHARTRTFLLGELDEVVRRLLDEPDPVYSGDIHLLDPHPLTPHWSRRITPPVGRTTIQLACSDATGRPFIVQLTVPDARHAQHLLAEALDAPCRTRREA